MTALNNSYGDFNNVVNFYLDYIQNIRGHKIKSCDMIYESAGFYPMAPTDSKNCYIFQGNLIFNPFDYDIGHNFFYISNIIDELSYFINIYHSGSDYTTKFYYFDALVTQGIVSSTGKSYNTSGKILLVKTDKDFF